MQSKWWFNHKVLTLECYNHSQGWEKFGIFLQLNVLEVQLKRILLHMEEQININHWFHIAYINV